MLVDLSKAKLELDSLDLIVANQALEIKEGVM